MNTSEIRQKFFSFFDKKGHQIVPSAPMVVKNDPTLMFTNAGMNQFKDFFLGNTAPANRRVANSQKCLRVSGKHNDLEEVGVDTYHHTMFEMLGNWSFGDYFKADAIAWAWELLTIEYGLPSDKLYVTVFGGDESDGVSADEESVGLWKKHIDESRILRCSKNDNFWEMGEVGPCGPCTEIHIDLRSKTEREKIDGAHLVNQDHPQVIEIWNLVFMQFNRKANGSLESLPETHVDTGMGLERLAMALQGKTSNYDTDIFRSLIAFMEDRSGTDYGNNEQHDIALRVIADHVRAIAFSIADGQLPSNTGAGYVIRRILRRAVRYGYQTLQLKEPFLCDLSVELGKNMGEAFPELHHQQELIRKVIYEEEQSFFRTLEQGIKRMDHLILQLGQENKTELSGSAVFELYDTYGFPLDLTSLIARENGLSIDEDGFQHELKQQKDRSRAASASTSEDWVQVHENGSSQFSGYDQLVCDVQLIRYRKVTQKNKVFYHLVLNPTPFYPEGGGQVGDRGWLVSPNERIAVIDTRKENNLILHIVEVLPADPSAVFSAEVNTSLRKQTTANHSATHLLHHALRTVLGTHVEQKGSLVNERQLRFDFSHFSKVTEKELAAIEEQVERAVRSHIELHEQREAKIEDAMEMGAMALFGEKYGEHVRVIQFGDSVELCGGTHVSNTGQIGLFKILSETAVAAGVRRIEAITSSSAETYFKERSLQLEHISDTLRHPKDPVKAVVDLLDRNNQLSKQLEKLQKEKAIQVKKELKSQIQSIGDIQCLATRVSLDAGLIKDILFQLKGETAHFFGIIGGIDGEKCSISIIADENLVKERGLHAGNLVKEVAPLIQGGGGGQAFFATAGGKNPEGIDAAINAVLSKLN
jgi:alanyl-tRNA synthetase